MKCLKYDRRGAQNGVIAYHSRYGDDYSTSIRLRRKTREGVFDETRFLPPHFVRDEIALAWRDLRRDCSSRLRGYLHAEYSEYMRLKAKFETEQPR